MSRHLVTSIDASPAPRHGRRGVLLLVVLSMLTLFMLLGVTYLIMAARVRSTSRAFLKLADDQAKTSVTLTPLLKDAALQVIRGTTNTRSAIRYHDLLADKYGTSQTFNVASQSLVAGGQMLSLRISPSSSASLAGRVVTYLDGPDGVANTSSRIVAWDSANQVLYVARPRRLAPAGVTSITQILVNGPDFSGTGFSRYAGTVGTGTSSLNDSSLAPNQTVSPDGSFDPSGANEDYDAIDEQNMALAVADADGTNGKLRSFDRPAVVDFWIRDFARNNPAYASSVAAAQARLTVLAQQAPPPLAANDPLLSIRRATLRPFAFDHYQDNRAGTDFTGKSLSAFNTIAANPGDVDNDGDGTLDSVWLDLGYPAIYMADTRKYVKPLFAIHCVDLGGRVNLNSHGSPTHGAESSVTSNAAFAPRRLDNGTASPPTQLRGGAGFGPADVRLDAVLGGGNVAAVMLGSNSTSGAGDGIRRDLGAIVGRYGDGVASSSTLARPGVPNQNDRRIGGPTLWTDRGLPETYWSFNSAASLFGGSPPDFWARLSVGIDHRGQPVYANRTPSATVLEATDNPYELDLYKTKPGNGYAQTTSYAWVDQPFTPAELEAVVRPFDIDNAAALPPRGLAVSLTGAASSLTQNRMHVTTESWDTPAVIAQDFIPGASHDPDLADGLKMDLNRPFGDARDNDGDGIVDEPGESNGAAPNVDDYKATYGSGWLLTRGQSPGFSQPGPNEPHLRSRQLYAYHLFNLLESLRSMFAPPTASDPGLRLFAVKADRDDDAAVPTAIDPSLNDSAPAIALALQDAHNQRGLAQWCVNVVDFLDGDAIMTPFRYKSGTGSQYVVWGCEQPDLMVTETLAFHDRRTADTKNDNNSQKTTQDFNIEYRAMYDAWKKDPSKPQPTPFLDDMDFDQVRIPEGSLFLEFYGTRSPNTPNLPRELYTFDAGTNQWYLDLGRVPAGGTDPVWRLSLSDNEANSPSNDVFAKLAAKPDTEWLSPGSNPAMLCDLVSIDRYVWFSQSAPTNTGAGPTRDNTFYVKDSSLTARVKPGGYLVVGPRPSTAIGSVANGSGGQTWGVPSNQRIVLNAGTPATGSPAVGVYDVKGQPNPSVSKPAGAVFGNPLPPPDGRAETSAAWVAMDRPAGWSGSAGVNGIGLNVSEPLRSSYYPAPSYSNPLTGVVDAYGPLDSNSHSSFLDTPVDRGGGCPLANDLLSMGTFANFCTVFVERLADPTRPHNLDPTSVDWNPYIVIDFMPVDLTVFNGESSAADPSETQGPDRSPSLTELPVPKSGMVPQLPDYMPLPIADSTHLHARHTYFHTRQRGFGADLPNYENDGTLFGVGAVKRNPHPFKQIGALTDLTRTPDRTGTAADQLPGGKATQPRSASGLAASEIANFMHELGQSPDGRTTPSQWSKVPYHSLGWVNPSFGRRLDAADSVPASYYGAPDRPFPWIVWNDRPFANPYELIFVPRTPPSRLFTNYRNLDYPGGGTPAGSDYSNTSSTSYNTDDIFAACTPGAHLLPITAITDVPAPAVASQTSTRSRAADLLVRVFEYVRVRSPFIGAETVLANLGGDGRPDRFVGPFNRLSTYREPGRINVNTIHPDTTVGAPVWNALCGAATGTPETSYASIVAARSVQLPFLDNSGNLVVTGTMIRPYRPARGTRSDYSEAGQPQSQSNTYFATSWLTNPRTDTSQWLAPSGTIPQIGDRLSVRSFTLLGDALRTGTAAGRRPPLFQQPAQDAWANDGARNAWFRFESLVRANANATVRSEVYAIWVTMGLFEVASGATPSRVYPDGYRLVREYGSDTGDVTRHRSFFIYDRSIPVGFQQGNDLNVQDGILVERFIE